MKLSKAMWLAPVLLLGACSVNTYCEGPQDYEKAQALPPLKGVEGLKLPESASALKIPPPPANPVRYGERVKDEKGDETTSCLDKPPAMPPPAQPKVEEKKPA